MVLQSTDNNFQESGRGGHSGDPIVFWKPKDCPMRKELTSTRDHQVANVRTYLENDSLPLMMASGLL